VRTSYPRPGRLGVLVPVLGVLLSVLVLSVLVLEHVVVSVLGVLVLVGSCRGSESGRGSGSDLADVRAAKDLAVRLLLAKDVGLVVLLLGVIDLHRVHSCVNVSMKLDICATRMYIRQRAKPDHHALASRLVHSRAGSHRAHANPSSTRIAAHKPIQHNAPIALAQTMHPHNPLTSAGFGV